tara:strand:+ start:1531 stop:1794 length:264 start_codon:yes stop_codon:yes gene_type:complete
MSELKASSVTASKIKNIMSSGVIDSPPIGATHYDMFWCQFIKKCGDKLRFFEDGMWKISGHRDGANMLTNGECINLWTKKLEQEASK